MKHPTTNSLGQPIATTPEGIKNFWRWFANSKVVDDQGRPLVVYHGTAANFDEFSANTPAVHRKRENINGIYFTDNIMVAGNYRGRNGRIKHVYLKIENPLYTKPGIEKLRKKKIPFMDAKLKVLEQLNKTIHDGVIFDGNSMNPKEFVVFSPNQIKSATGNNGNYSTKDASILNGIDGVEKEPWQMTHEEYYVKGMQEFHIGEFNDLHKQYVKKAMADGKPVPNEVLADYPELQQKSEPVNLELLREEYEAKTFDELIAIKKKLYPNPDIESPMSDAEKLLQNIMADKASEMNRKVMERRNFETKISPLDTYRNQHEINVKIEKVIAERGDNTDHYSEVDKQFIRRYSGSGGLANQGATGKGILYEFFTPPYICDLMYKLAYAHGYDGGNILEPSCGTGELIRPAADYTKVTGFEINKTSADITRILYPGVQVYSDYFETAFMQAPRFTDTLRYPNKTWLKQYPFSLVIGNPPYGRYQSFFSKYFNKKLFTQVEIFFIIQGIELLKPGGLLVYLQSSNFLRNGDKYTEAKEYLDKIADFVDAYRLPSVFKYSEVPTDIMVLRKKLK